ncbi:MAG: tripartite tricarboxylate transporter substrate binding protein BugE [Rhodoferax sp.]
MKIWNRILRGLAALMLSSAALAQSYPTKPIVLVIPFPPGGSTDIVGRIVGEAMSKELGQPVVVDNKGGAGGAIGAKAIADAARDGYTLGVATVSTHVINPVVQGPKLRYDPLKDFTFIGQIAAVPNVVSIHPSLPAQNMSEFLAHLRKNPGKVDFGTPGVGSLGHMMGESLKHEAKVSMTHIPYRGAGPALTAALGGQVQVFFDNLPSSLPHIQAGKLRALAVAASQRVPALPSVPTFAEVGLPSVNDPAWFGLIGPAGLPEDVVKRLNDALRKALAQPDVVKRLALSAATPIGNSPTEFHQALAKSLEATRAMVRDAGLKFD